MNFRIICLLLTTLFVAGCATNNSRLKLEDLPNGSISLSSMTPDLNTPLTKDSIIVANLDYEVEESDISKVRIFAQFATNKTHTTFDGDFPSKDELKISNRKGKAVIEFPLSYVWSKERLKRPIQVHFNLAYKIGNGGSIVLGQTGKYTYEN